MRIRVHLFASLRDRYSGDNRGRSEVELDEGATLAGLIERLEIPDPLAQMVLIDGLQEPRSREERARRALEDGQTVSICPPVAGG